MFDWLRCKMTKKQLQGWERTRNRGAVFFVLVQGVLVFGGITTVLSLCGDVLLLHKPLNAILFLKTLAQWALAGLFWGWMMWRITEKNYQSTLTETKLNKSSESH